MASFRPTAHAGENRCWPCTLVNLALAAVLGGLLAPLSPVLSGVVWVGGVLVVWYLGYLVPGTPYLTSRFLPDRIRGQFGKEPVESAVDGTGDTNESVEQLQDVGVLERDDNDRFTLTPRFRASWDDRIDALRGNERAQRSGVAAMVDIDVDRVGLQEIDETRGLSVRIEGGTVSQWLSRAALVADVAASETLADVDGEWMTLAPETRHRILVGLRQFRDRCPTCDGRIVSEREETDSCCWTSAAVTARCAACTERLYVVTEHPS